MYYARSSLEPHHFQLRQEPRPVSDLRPTSTAASIEIACFVVSCDSINAPVTPLGANPLAHASVLSAPRLRARSETIASGTGSESLEA
jgi:hypothetical protein